MLKKTAAIAVLAATAFAGATPAFAHDFGRGYHRERGYVTRVHRGHATRVYYRHAEPRRAFIVRRPVVVERRVVQRPVAVYHERRAPDVLGGLIVGAMLGAVIASHAAY